MKTESHTPDDWNRLVKRLSREWQDDPNVLRIGWGLAERKGRIEPMPVVIFWVREKIASERVRELKGTRTIPSEIDGLPTDVQVREMRPLAAVGTRDDVIADPLNGGWTTSNADEHTIWFNGWGTLGILCTDNNDGAMMALSNWHVWADGAEQGDTIIQPAHPRTEEHVESVTKVLACGALFTSLLEWESPDPIALGLYGGAAAAAVAAALSDYKDPVRRGQEATPTAPGERTRFEQVTAAVEYPDLPVPGRPFRTDVKWEYERTTNLTVHSHAVSEPQINAQFLAGKYVTTNKSGYQAGERILIQAAIWDYQFRPCDSYHVVAHLIPDKRPQNHYPVVLAPGICPRKFPVTPPAGESEDTVTCYDFGAHRRGERFPSGHRFDWLRCEAVDGSDLLISDWLTAGAEGAG